MQSGIPRVPIPLRLLFAAHPELLTSILRIVHRVISGFLIKQAGLKHNQANTGAVTLIQRFGSAANLNIHIHGLVLDGVYRLTEGGREFPSFGARSRASCPRFHAVRAPTVEQLQTILTRIIKRLMRLLTRQGYLVEEQEMIYLADLSRARWRLSHHRGRAGVP